MPCRRQRDSSAPLVHRAGVVYGIIAMIYAAAVLVLVNNPLLTGVNLGHTLIFNALLYVYGVPAALCGVLAYIHDKDTRQSPVHASRGHHRLAPHVCARLTGSPSWLRARPAETGSITFLEWGTYSIAWMTLGLLSLAAGMAFSRELVRRGRPVHGRRLLYAMPWSVAS